MTHHACLIVYTNITIITLIFRSIAHLIPLMASALKEIPRYIIGNCFIKLRSKDRS
jgi:hypothetical protein